MHAILRARERARCRGRINERARGRRERECAHARESASLHTGGSGLQNLADGVSHEKGSQNFALDRRMR